MIVTLVRIWVNKPHIDEFITATIENHANTIKEPGNLRFDVLHDAADPARFVLYEVFESDEAIAVHKSTSHYIKWRDLVAGWMAQPRQGIRYQVVRPVED
jgi:autoinducer 2-degrading protein